jgi:hypothetical protein
VSGVESQSAEPRAKRRWYQYRLRSLFLLIFAAAVLVSGIEFARQKHCERACRNDFEEQCKVLDLYYARYGHFPPPYLTGKNGRPIHSWRTLLMPFQPCSNENKYGQYKFNEPWDGPNNNQFWKRYYAYSCPGYAKASHTADYVCVVGGTLWPVPRMAGKNWQWDGAGWPRAKDGGVLPQSGKAVLLVELTESDTPWTKPADISLSELTSLLDDDGTGVRFGERVRRVLAVDAKGTPYILDAVRDIEQIRKIVRSEDAVTDHPNKSPQPPSNGGPDK